MTWNQSTVSSNFRFGSFWNWKRGHFPKGAKGRLASFLRFIEDDRKNCRTNVEREFLDELLAAGSAELTRIRNHAEPAGKWTEASTGINLLQELFGHETSTGSIKGTKTRRGNKK